MGSFIFLLTMFDNASFAGSHIIFAPLICVPEKKSRWIRPQWTCSQLAM